MVQREVTVSKYLPWETADIKVKDHSPGARLPATKSWLNLCASAYSSVD